MVANYMNCSIDYLFGLTETFEVKLVTPHVSFSERLTLLLKETNISKNKLSVLCNVTSSTVSKWLLHGQLPKPDVVCSPANYFNCSIDYLVGRSNFR